MTGANHLAVIQAHLINWRNHRLRHYRSSRRIASLIILQVLKVAEREEALKDELNPARQVEIGRSLVVRWRVQPARQNFSGQADIQREKRVAQLASAVAVQLTELLVSINRPFVERRLARHAELAQQISCNQRLMLFLQLVGTHAGHGALERVYGGHGLAEFVKIPIVANIRPGGTRSWFQSCNRCGREYLQTIFTRPILILITKSNSHTRTHELQR